MSAARLPTPLALVVSVLVAHPAAAQDGEWHTIKFETSEVTQANVAVSPDGRWLVFTLLGHLFRVPVQGGTAEQLTFGPSYDTETEVKATSTYSNWKPGQLYS